MKKYTKVHRSLMIGVTILVTFTGVVVAAKGIMIAYKQDRSIQDERQNFLATPATRNSKAPNSMVMKSQESTASAATESLTGKRVTPEEATKSAYAIVVATLVNPGIPSGDGVGQIHYDNATIDVSRSLKGDLPAGPLKISFLVITIPGEKEEHLPAKGVPYIFFLKKQGPDFEGIKILRATDGHVQMVTNLLP